jgi:hypothetical protein
MAVATRQKSTARRFVSILAVLEGTYLMLCTAGTAVTTRPVGAVPASAVLSDKVPSNTVPAITGPSNTGPIVA